MHCKVEQEEIQEMGRSNIVQQTSFWARVKSNQGIDPVAFRYKVSKDLLYPSQDSTRAVEDDMLVLLRNIDEHHCMAYVPYGPEYEPEPENHGKFLEELSEVMRSSLPKNCAFIRYDLPWENQWAKEADFFDMSGNWMGPPAIQNQEFRVNFNTQHWNLMKSHSDNLPSNTIFLNLNQSPDRLLNNMKPKTRYNIRLSQRRGVRVTSHGVEKLDDWYKLYAETARRNGISLHKKANFESVLSAPYLDSSVPADVQLLMADFEGEYLAAMFLVISRKRGTYLFGASSGHKRNLMAAYAIQWDAIRRAQQAGCEEYDMFGTSPNANPAHPMYGLFRFKSGFGGHMFHSMGCWDYPLIPEKYKLFRAQEVQSPKYHVN